jgi:hypothetical protein
MRTGWHTWGVAARLVDELDRRPVILELFSIVRADEGAEAGAPRRQISVSRHPPVCVASVPSNTMSNQQHSRLRPRRIRGAIPTPGADK